MLGARLHFVTYLDPLLRVDADNDARGTIDLAVNPYLAVVVGIRLELQARSRQGNPTDLFRHLNSNSVPGKGETHGDTLSDVGALLPPGVVKIRKPCGTR